jgi:hypothetical protein
MAETSLDCYFVDGARNQQGPVPVAEIVRLIRDGTIRRETLIWHAGMADWSAAGQMSEFAPLFAPRMPVPPARPLDRRAPISGVSPGVAVDGPADGLIAAPPVWGLFWRVVVAAIGGMFVIPAPWAHTMVYRFVCAHIWLPDGRRLTFSGKAGDIWYAFIGLAALSLISVLLAVEVRPLSLVSRIVSMPLIYMLLFFIFRWVCAKVGSEDGSVKIAFTGGFWGYVGWNLLVYVSIFTIIGWAWALKYMMRWICRNISGTVGFEFVGGAGAILWRTFVTALASIFLIPIPWVIRWYMVWFFSQVRVVAAH